MQSRQQVLVFLLQGLQSELSHKWLGQRQVQLGNKQKITDRISVSNFFIKNDEDLNKK